MHAFLPEVHTITSQCDYNNYCIVFIFPELIVSIVQAMINVTEGNLTVQICAILSNVTSTTPFMVTFTLATNDSNSSGES